MFAPLPQSMAQLASAVATMGQPTIQTPPPMEEIGLRLRRIYQSSRESGYAGLSVNDVRKLPYAYWLQDERPLPETDPDLVRLYWEEYLLAGVQGSSRRGKRWLTPLFFVYCASFDPADSVFAAYARRLAATLAKASGPFAAHMQGLQSQFEFFVPGQAPRRLAERFFMDARGTPDLYLSEMLLWPGFSDTRLGRAVFAAGLTLAPEALRTQEVVTRLLQWSKRLAVPVSQTELRVPFADALLKPWSGRQPPDDVKKTLLAFFIRTYGDPRTMRIRWEGVSEQALAVLLRWLTGDTLRGFMKLLERTADEIWMHRQKFWMAYYDAGYIDEAWLALGSAARIEANRLKVDELGMGYSQLEGSVTSDQSVLLLKVGHLVFTEWSHNGSLRAYREDDPRAPKLYQRDYYGADLRAAVSLDFHEGMNANPELRHMNSEGGTWQRKARDLIRRHTGVNMRNADIYDA